MILFAYIIGNTPIIVLNSKVTNIFNANAAQKKEKNNAASLNINHIKQYWIILCNVVTSLIPYNVSVSISMDKKLIEKTRIKISKLMLYISNVYVHKDNPKNVNPQKTKYIKNNGE